MPRAPYKRSTIRFAAGEAGAPIAYRPNEVLVASTPFGTTRQAVADGVNALLDEVRGRPADPGQGPRPPAPGLRVARQVSPRWAVLEPDGDDDIDPLKVARLLRELGIPAQPNYVRFVDTMRVSPNYIAPNYIAPNYIAPNYIAPNYIAPNYIAPNYIAPNYIAPNYIAGGGCGAAVCAPDPSVDHEVPTITARTSYGPRPGPDPLTLPNGLDARIHVLDVRFQGQKVDLSAERTAMLQAQADSDGPLIDSIGQTIATNLALAGTSNGASRGLEPLLLAALDAARHGTATELNTAFDALEVEPSSDGLGANVDGDHFVDPVTNHAVFIEGIIDRVVGGSSASIVEHHAISGTLGEVSDEALARTIDHVVAEESDQDALRIFNLSLSGFTDDDTAPPVLADSVAAAQAKGWLIVASAGNQGMCRPAWPAALPGVVAVAAYGPCGPASFSNYGPWVDACGPGVDIVSEFPGMLDPGLTVCEAPERIEADTEYVTGFATWSGTSFSAPYVAAMLAARVADAFDGGTTPMGELHTKALDELIAEPTLVRYPLHGTIVSEDRVSVRVTRESNL